MEAVIGLGFTVLFFRLWFWALHSLSVLRIQMEEVLTRLRRIEGKTEPSAGQVQRG